jgi:phosphoglycerate kinase
VATHLAKLLGQDVAFVAGLVTPEALAATEALAPGGVLLLENTRFDPRETENDRALSRSLAGLGDVYVNDAFGSAHRAHASTAGVAEFLQPAVAGLLMERELEHLGGLLEKPARPFVTILGGAKVSDKIELIENLLGKVDRLCVGGAMACTFLRAQGLEMGNSLVEAELVETAARLLKSAGDRLVLPSDALVAPALERGSEARRVSVRAVPKDQMMLDIGSETAAQFAGIIGKARTILWNGPVGAFEHEPFATGSRHVAEAVAEATSGGATSVVGGGDTAAAVAELGLADRLTHVSTGGGATLEFLAGRELPGVAVLTDR